MINRNDTDKAHYHVSVTQSVNNPRHQTNGLEVHCELTMFEDIKHFYRVTNISVWELKLQIMCILSSVSADMIQLIYWHLLIILMFIIAQSDMECLSN